jgi:transcriptional regulator with XRE-family HTH domain
MANRLREIRKAAGLKLRDIAKAANTTNQMVGMLERGDRKLTVEWMERLAKPLGVQPSELMAINTTHHQIRLIGEVQAGNWQKPEEQEGFEGEILDLPLPEIYKQLRPYALRVVGPSMNLVYPEGTILICCHLEELHEDPISGKRYIIQNIDAHNGIETTVKEFMRDEQGRPWAWPRSTHTAHQMPVALDQAPNGHTVVIKARVVFSLKPE